MLDELEKYGLDENVVFDLQYDATATTYATEALQCKSADPDIFLALTLPLDLAMWVKAMSEQEFYPPFMVTSSTVTWDSFTELFVSPDIYDDVFNDEHTAVFSGGTVFEDIPIGSVRDFADRYAAYCEAEGITNRYEWAGVPGGGQAMYCLWDALEKAGSADPEKINDALRDMVIPQDDPHFVFPTLAPAVEWNSNGTLKNYSPFMTQIQDGVEVMVWPEELQQADPLW